MQRHIHGYLDWISKAGMFTCQHPILKNKTGKSAPLNSTTTTTTTTTAADDTSLTVSASDTASLETQINQELKCVNEWLLANKLTLNVTKTEFMLITTRQKLTFIESNLNINIESQPIRQVKSIKTLGLHLQENSFVSPPLVDQP